MNGLCVEEKEFHIAEDRALKRFKAVMSISAFNKKILSH